jgi:hypothetical protein
MKKVLLLGMVTLLLSFGMVLVSCGSKCDNNGNCEVTFDDSGAIQSQVYCFNGTCNVPDASRAGKNAKCDC